MLVKPKAKKYLLQIEFEPLLPYAIARVSDADVVNVLPHILSMPSEVKVVACVVAIVPDAYPPGIYKSSIEFLP